MTPPTEPIGSIPRPLRLVDAFAGAKSDDPKLEPLYNEAIRDTLARFEMTGSPVITDSAPFSDDISTTRDTAFAKIQARVLGTALAAEIIQQR